MLVNAERIDYNWLIFPVNLQHLQFVQSFFGDYNWLIFPVNLQRVIKVV